MDRLQKDNISVVLRQNKNALIYGMTFVDHKTYCVFNGSDLGKAYTAKGIQDRLQPDTIQQITPPAQKQRKPTEQPANMPQPIKSLPNEANPGLLEKANESVSAPSDRLAALPFELRNNKRKKKRRRLSL